MRSSPAAVPAQKNAVSGEAGGRSTATGGAAWACAGRGRNLRIRKSMVATGSSPAYQVERVVTNQPSPSAVRLGPVTSSRLARTLTCSPCRR